MSASDEWTEYHLTPSGWVEGSTRVDFAGVKQKPAPPDRVRTCRWRELLSSGYGPMHKSLIDEWESEDKAAVKALTDQYGPCPRHL